jgi:hypothetical protein
MLQFMVTDIANNQPVYLDVEKELPERNFQQKHLKNSIREVMRLLKATFWSEEKYLSETLDNLLALTETTLQTHFA